MSTSDVVQVWRALNAVYPELPPIAIDAGIRGDHGMGIILVLDRHSSPMLCSRITE